MLRIVHLSDLHLSPESIADQRIILRELFKDLSTYPEQGKKIDFIFFTGDLVAKGNYSEATVNLINDEFLYPLLHAVKLPASRLFIAPGNHDVQVGEIKPLFRQTLDGLSALQDVNSILDDIEGYAELWKPLGAFNQVIKGIESENPIVENKLFRSYELKLDKVHIGIAIFNSAWRATGRPNDDDCGKLLIGQRQIDALTHSIKNCHVKLALVHHPLHWLAPFEYSATQSALLRNFDGIFCGHNHEASATNIINSTSSMFVSNAGCLYQSRKYFNGYSVIDFNPDKFTWTVKAKEYYPQRECFDVATSFAHNGEATFVVNDTKADKQTSTLPSMEYLSSVKEAIDSQLLSFSISEKAPKAFKSIFVEPPLSSVSEKKIRDEESEKETIEYLTLSCLLGSEKSIFFVGERESGKTTILHHICSESCDAGFSRRPTFCAYINLEMTRMSHGGILEAITLFSKGSYKRAEFIDMLEKGRMIVCMDSFSPTDEKLVDTIKEFVEKYPKNRYFFSVHESFQASLTKNAIPRIGLNSEVVYIHSFGRKQTRQLMEKWFGEPSALLRDRVDGTLKSLQRLQIPRTPFLISVLLWIQERNIPFDPVNHAEIIDIFIDGLLEKLRETKRRGSIDSTIKRHFLSNLAHAMYISEQKAITQNWLEKFTIDYFERKLLPSSAAALLDELKQRGILIDVGEKAAFKFDCIRAFFLSTKMKESQDFLTLALSKENFVKLGQELDYFSGKNRAEHSALESSLSILDQYYDPIRIDLDLNLFDEITLENSPLTEDVREKIRLEAFINLPTSSEQEDLLDEIDSGSAVISKPKNISTEKRHGFEMTEYVEALRITSMVLRNSELIDDSELKQKAFEIVANRWCEILLAVLIGIELKSDDENGEEMNKIFIDIPPSLASYSAKMLVPNVIFHMGKEYLGTKKLELVIDESVVKSKSTIAVLFSTMLALDLSLPKRYQHLRLLIEEHASHHRFLAELIFINLYVKLIFKKYSAEEEATIKALILDAFDAMSSSTSKRQRDTKRANLLAYIEKQKLTGKFSEKKTAIDP